MVSITFIILLEIVCARLAFYTLGEITSLTYFMGIFLNLVPLAYLVFTKYKTSALSLIFLIALLIIPYQLYLGHKWIFIQEETSNILGYIYQEKLKTESYPESLSEYQFTYPQYKEDIGYEKNDDQFQLYYSIGTKNTSHYFRSEIGKWGYYPD